MESLKELDERAVGDRFIDWFNTKFGLKYTFSRRAGEAPDLVYALPDKTELFVEVTSAYYGKEYAKFMWNGVRSEEDQVLVTESVDDDSKLVTDIVRIINQKCNKQYERHCILVISSTCFWTSARALVQLLAQREFPENNFAGIYVHGRFSRLSLDFDGNDYSMIPIKAYSNSGATNGKKT